MLGLAVRCRPAYEVSEALPCNVAGQLERLRGARLARMRHAPARPVPGRSCRQGAPGMRSAHGNDGTGGKRARAQRRCGRRRRLYRCLGEAASFTATGAAKEEAPAPNRGGAAAARKRQGACLAPLLAHTRHDMSRRMPRMCRYRRRAHRPSALYVAPGPPPLPSPAPRLLRAAAERPYCPRCKSLPRRIDRQCLGRRVLP